MQITSPDYDATPEGGVAPFEELSVCKGFRNHLPLSGSVVATATTTTLSVSSSSSSLSQVTTASMTTATTTTASTTTRPSTTTSGRLAEENEIKQVVTTRSLVPAIRPRCDCQETTTSSATTTTTSTGITRCSCNEPSSGKEEESFRNSKALKRKAMDDEGEESGEGRIVSHSGDSERCRRLLLLKRRLLSNLAQKNNVPLFYLYGDLLLIPKYRWGSGIGNGGAQRGMIPNHMSMNPLEASNSSSEPPSKHHGLVQLEIDNHLSEEEDSSYQQTLHSLIEHLNEYGVCVLDGFLADDVAEQILNEVEALHYRGEFRDGQVMSRNIKDQSRRIIRGDKITWVTGNEHNSKSIGHLVSKVDRLVGQANRHQEARKLARYDIKWRTLAMVACYPGEGSHYVKHVDNPDGDGRCITTIYYLNKNWQPEDGGILRIMPVGSGHVANIEPIFNRMLFFWSDRRNPHEVLPAHCTRYAITLWYHDQREREEYLARMAS